MDLSGKNVISEDWIRKKLNITHDDLGTSHGFPCLLFMFFSAQLLAFVVTDDIKMMSLPGTYQEKITHLGNSLQKFARLKELDLSRNSLISLEGIEHLKNLEKLNL